MEENVAIDSSKQKQFLKTLKGMKKLMKKTGAIPEKPIKEKKPIKHGKVIKRKRKVRGLVYLSHIPHGFYEHEMTEYFKQFGMVTNARVIRSKRTGRSKGHAFVEFKDIAVAQVVAETMNNYLMGKRLIKAVYIPPKDQRLSARRKKWNEQFNPGNTARLNAKKKYNADKSESQDLKIARKLLSNLGNTKKKLKELGIEYDMFAPVDVPKKLLGAVVVKEENSEDADSKKDTVKKPKKKNKKKAANKPNEDNEIDDKERSSELQQEKKQDKKTELKKQKQLNKKDEVTDNSKVTGKKEKCISDKIADAGSKKNKKNKKKEILKVEVNKGKQEQKQLKMKEAGVKPPEDFITIEGDDGSDDSDYEFDSDEFEKIMDGDDSDTNASVDEEDDADVTYEELSDNSDSKEKPMKNNKAEKKEKTFFQPKVIKKVEVKQKKRKAVENNAVQTKKTKFGKQTNKNMPKKQFKMKK